MNLMTKFFTETPSIIEMYFVIIGLVTGIIGIVWIGYPLFVFFFYGFAP